YENECHGDGRRSPRYGDQRSCDTAALEGPVQQKGRAQPQRNRQRYACKRIDGRDIEHMPYGAVLKQRAIVVDANERGILRGEQRCVREAERQLLEQRKTL